MEENAFVRELIQTYAEKNMITPMIDDHEESSINILTIDTDTEGNA